MQEKIIVKEKFVGDDLVQRKEIFNQKFRGVIRAAEREEKKGVEMQSKLAES